MQHASGPGDPGRVSKNDSMLSIFFSVRNAHENHNGRPIAMTTFETFACCMITLILILPVGLWAML